MDFRNSIESRSVTRAAPQALDFPVYPVSPAPHPVGVSSQTSLWDFWRVMMKRKWVIAITIVVVVTLAAIASFRMTPIYEAVGRIAVFREGSDILGFKDAESTSSDDWDYTVALDTQIKVLQSNALAMQVIKSLKLDADPRFIAPDPKAKKTPMGLDTIDERRETQLLGTFSSNLHINTVPRTRIIELHYSSPYPKLAAEVVNGLANSYIERNFQTKFEATMRTSDWLAKQLSDLQMKVEASQEKLVQYQKEHGILGLDEKQNIITTKLDELNRQLTSAQGDRMQKEAAYRFSLSGDPELLTRTGSDELLTKLRSQEADLRTQYAQASVQFGPQYPKVQQLDIQLKETEAAINREQKRVAQRLRDEYLASLQREKLLAAALDQQKQAANQLNESAIQYNLLKREVDSNRQLYEGLLTKLKEAGISAGLRSSNVRIIDVARVPVVPAKPNIPRNIILSLLIGTMGGIGLAFLVEALDNTIRSPEEVELVAALPSLAVIPASRRTLTGPGRGSSKALPKTTESSNGEKQLPVEIICHSHPRSQVAESYRALRTQLLLSSSGGAPKVVLVTSPLAQEGKTTTSVNTAIALAQKGSRVLLVDADLRRPSVHRSVGLRSAPGLSRLLAGAATEEHCIHSWQQQPNLFVLPAGVPPPNPSELLGSAVMKQFISRWRESYDHIVIDTPPVLSVTDAVVLGVEADAVVLVIRAGRTPRQALRRARELMVQVNASVVGVVINAVNFHGSDYYYYYGRYYYGGKYGYGSEYYDEAPKS